jgi:hypothetical protein
MRAASAKGVAVEELKKQEVDVLLAKVVASTERRRKYERAADDPWKPVAPDAPVPKSKIDLAEWLHPGDHPPGRPGRVPCRP